jgi:hypothetical protein
MAAGTTSTANTKNPAEMTHALAIALKNSSTAMAKNKDNSLNMNRRNKE